jgi:hypothetical protein
MTDSYSPNLKLATPGPDPGAQSWNVELDRNRAILDAQNGIGDLAVTAHDVPVSTSLLIDVAPGIFLPQSGVVASYAGSLSNAVTASATTSVYLTNAGVLTLSVTGFPASPALYIPLAVVVAGATTITSIADARVPFSVCGGSYLPLTGGTLSDGANIVLGTTTGTKIGTAVGQKAAFFGATPVIQQTGGVATAAATYGTNEEGMLQRAYNALRAYGLLS